MVMFLDIQTLSFVMGVTIISLSLSMLHYAISRKIYPGFRIFTLGTIFIGLAFFLIGFRHSLSSFITIVIPNALIYASLAMFYFGFKSFVKKKEHLHFHITLVVLLSLVLVPYFTYIVPNVNLRIILISFVAAFYFLNCAFTLIKEVRANWVKLNKMLTATLILMSSLFVFR